MNPRFHSEFAELCAIFYSGEISEEEWALLQVHLAYCEQCQATFEQYKQIQAAIIPGLAAAAAESAVSVSYETESTLAAAEDRLMAGLKTPAEPVRSIKSSNKSAWWLGVGFLAACGVIFGYLAREHAVRTQRSVSQAQRPAVPATTTGSSVKTALETQSDPQENLEAQEEVVRLRREVSELRAQSSGMNKTASTLQDDLATNLAKKKQLESNRDALASQLAGARVDVQSLREQVAAAQLGNSKQAAQQAALEDKVRSLTASLQDTSSALEDRERMLALDKDFLSHDRDIRDLIGARDLYIADIFDTTENGRTAKPFGRLFYTRDRSLVFYGFDLEKQPGLKQSAAFQVWGSGSDSRPVNLGLFYQEDSHKRWVLRVNDAKTLSRLNMVFVTVEPPGGSNKPTGKQLLRAYLQIQANHP